MKFAVPILAIIAAVAADVSHLVNNEYLPPVHNYPPSVPQYHHPAPVPQVDPVAPVLPQYEEPTIEDVEPAHELHDDGYVYKNPVEERRRARRRYRLRYRHRY